MALFVPQYKISLFHKDETEDRQWDYNNENDLNDVQEIDVRVGIENKQDSFKIILGNTWKFNSGTGEFYNKYSSLDDGLNGPDAIKIAVDDRLRIYAWSTLKAATYPANSTEIAESFLFDGTVTQFSYEVNASGKKQYVLTGANSTERLLKSYYPAFHTVNDAHNKAHQIIQDLLLLVADKSGYDLEWDSDNSVATKEINYASKYRPVYQQIEELSTKEMTGIKDCYYYIEGRESGGTYTDYFIWKEKDFPDTFTSSETMTEGDQIENMKILKGTWDVINAVRMNCGKDPSGNQIHSYAWNVESIGKVGAKWKVMSKNYSGPIMAFEKIESGDFGDKDNFPSAYDYTSETPAPEDNFTIGSVPDVYSKGDYMTIADDAEYKEMIRKLAKFKGSRDAQDIVEQYGTSRYKFTVRYGAGSLAFTPAQVVQCVSHSYGWGGAGTADDTTQRLRVVEYRHRLSKSGWKTEFQLEQDWELATEGNP